MKISNTLFFLLISSISFGQSFMTNEILDKVFKISLDTFRSSATGFIVEDNGELFMVTAKHIFPKTHLSGSKIRIYVKDDSIWNYMDGTLFHHSNNKIDISIIRIYEGEKTIIKNKFNLTIESLIYGDEGYILGFPFSMSTPILNREFPLPLIKRVINSGTIKDKGAQVIFLDGHNNPGFSGGPIVFKNHLKKGGHIWQIVGVVSGYVPQTNHLNSQIGVLKYQENSGIIIGYGSDHIGEIIKNTR